MSFFKIIGAEVNSANYGPETFNPNTGINSAGFILTTAAQRFVNGTPVIYLLSTGNTLPVGLVSGQTYYAVYANATGLNLAATVGGANLAVSNAGKSETGHTLMGMNTLAATQVRIFNNQGQINNFHVVNTSGIEVSNMTVAVAEVFYIQKNPGDSVYSNGSMLTLPISYRGA